MNLEAKTITISAKVSKVRGKRVVELEPNAVVWLETVKDQSLKASRRAMDNVKHAAGFTGRKRKSKATDEAKKKEFEALDENLEEWNQDAMRHTAISNHLALHGHEGKTATWAGNSPDVCQRHYKGLISQAKAAEYWSLLPVKPSDSQKA